MEFVRIFVIGFVSFACIASVLVEMVLLANNIKGTFTEKETV